MHLHRLPAALMTLGTLLSAALPAAEPQRDPADPAGVWDLTLLYKDDAAWHAAKDRIAAEIPKIKNYEGHLGESAATLRAAMDFISGLHKEFDRMAVYTSLKRDANTRDSAALELNQEADLLGTEFSRATSFVNPELLAVGEAKLRGFLDADSGLAPYRFPIMEVLRAAPHTLGAEAEGVLSASGLITDAPVSLYGILSNADIPWPTIKLSDGTEARLDQAGYTKWRSAPGRADRKAVFEAFWKAFRDYERTFGVALYSQVKTDWFGASVRKYPSSLAAALAGDDIPRSVYRTLVSETNANLRRCTAISNCAAACSASPICIMGHLSPDREARQVVPARHRETARARRHPAARLRLRRAILRQHQRPVHRLLSPARQDLRSL